MHEYFFRIFPCTNIYRIYITSKTGKNDSCRYFIYIKRLRQGNKIYFCNSFPLQNFFNDPSLPYKNGAVRCRDLPHTRRGTLHGPSSTGVQHFLGLIPLRVIERYHQSSHDSCVVSSSFLSLTLGMSEEE